jgi:hypothetical protein
MKHQLIAALNYWLHSFAYFYLNGQGCYTELKEQVIYY